MKCITCKQKETKNNPFVKISKDNSICRVCLEISIKMIEVNDEGSIFSKEMNNNITNIINPKEIYNHLNDYVVGHDETKKILSVALYNHLNRINSNLDVLEKTNVLIQASTGTGKTHLVKTLSKISNIPYIIHSSTSLTASGYIGKDVEDILTALIDKANGDISKAERGIVVLDEVDKIAKLGKDKSLTKDVNGEDVQKALLKIIEGDLIDVPISFEKDAPLVKFNTKNILFIFVGAFPYIDEIEDEKSLGFISGKIKEKEPLNHNDFIEFGMIPELMGRIHLITTMNDLTEDELLRIIDVKDGLMESLVQRFKLSDVDLKITNETKNKIVKMAIKEKLGARALRGKVEELLMEPTFNIEKYKNKVLEI